MTAEFQPDEMYHQAEKLITNRRKLDAKKYMRGAFPHKPLGEPKMKFEDTFSAETVLVETFFPDKTEAKWKATLKKYSPEIYANLRKNKVI